MFDSRLAWHFVPSSFSVYMKADIKTSAERILKAGRSSEQYIDLNDAVAKLKERRESESLRYKTFYGVDILDMSNYDFVIATDDKTVSQVADEIIAAFDKWLENR